MTPYDTGKVKIGYAYVRPQRNLTDRDMYKVQSALLRKPQYYKLQKQQRLQQIRKTLDGILWAASAAILLAIVITPNPFN